MTKLVSSDFPAYWIVVPAAGIGARMGAHCPKQYLSIAGRTVLEITLARLLTLPGIAGIYLVLGEHDEYWNDLPLSLDSRIRRITGGAERSDSVLNALNALHDQASPNDWVLVHDAARPCVHTESIQQLIGVVGDHPVGGILGMPVSDTLKQVSDLTINSTVDRRQLWQAQTPQMFRLGLLRECLERALGEKRLVTDESSAVELYGYRPLMVQGRNDNIKITRPEDLAIAELILQQQF